MRDIFAMWGWFIVILLLICGLGWLIQGNDFLLYRYFAPKQESVRRQVFEETKSYNQGMIQELQNMQFEYAKSTPEQQDAIGAIILHRAADYPEDRMPPDLRDFIHGLRVKRVER